MNIHTKHLIFSSWILKETIGFCIVIRNVFGKCFLFDFDAYKGFDFYKTFMPSSSGAEILIGAGPFSLRMSYWDPVKIEKQMEEWRKMLHEISTAKVEE